MSRTKTAREIGEFAQLLFQWPIRRSPRLALPIFIMLAAVIQTGAMVLFSIGYATPRETPCVRPSFYFIPPGSEVAQRLAPWLDANDPAVFSPLRATAAAVPASPSVKYRPSYEDPPPPLRPLPPDIEEPPAPPSPSQLRRASPPPAAAASPVAHPIRSGTSVQWMDGLGSRSPVMKTAAPSLPQGGRVPDHASQYQVAVGPEGVPLSCVLIDPCGDPAADEMGRSWILGCRYSPAETTSWGRVLLIWAQSQSPDPAPKP